MSAANRLMLLVSCMLATVFAGACGDKRSNALTQEMIDSSGVKTVHISVAEMTAARLRLADSVVLAIALPDGGSGAAGVVSAVTLSDGSYAALTSRRTVEFYSADGDRHAYFTQLGADTDAGKLFLAPGDTLVVRVRSDKNIRVTSLGKVVDTLSTTPSLIGVLSNGTLLSRRVYNIKTSGIANHLIPVTVEIIPREKFATKKKIAGNPVFKGELTRHTWALYLPWSRELLAAGAGEQIWISPTSSNELVQLTSDASLLRRVRWGSGASDVSASVLDTWRRMTSQSVERDAGLPGEFKVVRLEQISTLEADAPLRVIDRQIGGTDGSIWVREYLMPASAGRRTAPQVWVGFDSTAKLIGSLPIPADMSVMELSARHALLRGLDETTRLVRYAVVPQL